MNEMNTQQSADPRQTALHSSSATQSAVTAAPPLARPGPRSERSSQMTHCPSDTRHPSVSEASRGPGSPPLGDADAACGNSPPPPLRGSSPPRPPRGTLTGNPPPPEAVRATWGGRFTSVLAGGRRSRGLPMMGGGGADDDPRSELIEARTDPRVVGPGSRLELAFHSVPMSVFISL